MTALSAGLLAAWAVLVLTMPATVPVDDFSGQLIFAVPIVGGGAIAFLLTTRRPGNPVGWLLSASMVVLPLLFVGTDYGDHWLYVPDLPGALVVPLEALSNFGWAAGFPMLLVLVPLLFPDGHLLSRRWRPLIWLTATVAVFAVVATILDPGAYGDGHRHLANPLGLPGAHDLLSLVSGPVWSAIVVALMVTGGESLCIRSRRGWGDWAS